MENQDMFLAELSMLSQKYGIVVAGCGCCGSPYLLPVDDLMVGHPDGITSTKLESQTLHWLGLAQKESGMDSQARAIEELNAKLLVADMLIEAFLWKEECFGMYTSPHTWDVDPFGEVDASNDAAEERIGRLLSVYNSLTGKDWKYGS